MQDRLESSVPFKKRKIEIGTFNVQPEETLQQQEEIEVDKLEQNISYFAKYIAAGKNALITCKNTVSDVLIILRAIKTYIKEVGDKIIEDTKVRNQEKKRKETLVKIESLENYLASVKSQKSEIVLEDVLNIISLELLLEKINTDILGDIKPSLLIVPVVDIIGNYEYYFSWKEKEIYDEMIDRAYGEFKNKLMIKNLLRVHFASNVNNVTISDIIDQLVFLYNKNFNTTDMTITTHVLSLSGKTKVLEQIAFKPEETKLLDSDNKPILSAVNYYDVWRIYSIPQEDAAKEITQNRPLVNALEDNTPISTAFPYGRNSQANIFGRATSTVSAPLVDVMPISDSPVETINQSDDEEYEETEMFIPGEGYVKVSGLTKEVELPVVGLKGKTPFQREVAAKMAISEISERCPTDVSRSIIQKLRKIEEKNDEYPLDIGSIAEISEKEGRLIGEEYEKIREKSKELKLKEEYSKKAHSFITVNENVAIETDENRTADWDRTVQSIFYNLYEQTEMQKGLRAKLLSSKHKPRNRTNKLGRKKENKNKYSMLGLKKTQPSAPFMQPPQPPQSPESIGGKKSLKKHQLNKKKHTRKMKKRRTHKNYKKH